MSLAPSAEPLPADAVPAPRKALHAKTRAWRSPVLDLDLDLGLPRVTQPLRVLRSSRNLTERALENSYRVATLDHDAPIIVEESAQFVRRVTGP